MGSSEIDDDDVLRITFRQSIQKLIWFPISIAVAMVIQATNFSAIGNIIMFIVGCVLAFDIIQTVAAAIIGGVGIAFGGSSLKLFIANALRLTVVVGLAIWYMDNLFYMFPEWGDPFLYRYLT